jgi:hypothetical protein
MGRNVEIVVFDREEYDGDWPPTNLNDCIGWLTSHLLSIPAEFRKSAKICIGSISSWEDSHYATIEITYTRPELAGETEKREQE